MNEKPKLHIQEPVTELAKKKAKKPRKSTPLSKVVFSLILTLSIGIFLIAGLKLISIRNTYKKAETTYKTIEKEVIAEVPELPYPIINFESLISQNADTVGYIFCEDLFGYPIVQGSNNDYYLHTMFNGEWNPAGTLFVDYRIPEGMDARNCVVYGHNMQDGSMFGQLYKFSDPDFYEAHREFHVYVPGHHYVYKVVSAYTASVEGFTYDFSFGSDEEFQQFLDWTLGSSWFTPDTELGTDAKIITLSTCLGNNDDDYRNVIILARESEITD